MSRAGMPASAWTWIASIWLALGLFDATQTVVVMRAEGMHHAWTTLFFTQAAGWLPWALATPMVAQLGRRYPPSQLRPVSTWVRHLCAWAVLALIAALWGTWLERLLNPWANLEPPPSFVHAWLDRFYNGLFGATILYVIILVVTHLLDSRDRLAQQQAETARLNEQLSKAQLEALRRQIEPHFLFNTLNAIAGLVREQRNDAAVGMIAGLSDFLRRVLRESNRQEVTLGDEVEFLERYLEIEKVRFGERLHVSMEIAEELFPAQVPALILQPMVENAVKHGIAQRVQGGTIQISASRTNGMLTLNVYNDGPPLPMNWEQTGSGIGIANVRTRLQGLYGSGFGLSMRNEGPSGVQVSVSVPWREE